MVSDIEEEVYEKTPYYRDYRKIEDARVSVVVKSMNAVIPMIKPPYLTPLTYSHVRSIEPTKDGSDE